MDGGSAANAGAICDDRAARASAMCAGLDGQVGISARRSRELICRRMSKRSKRSSPRSRAVAKTAQSAVAAEYRGLTVAEMTKLRVPLAQAGVYVRVVKNTLARRAIEGTSFECMKGSLEGPARARVLARGSGRGRASRQGFREGARQARDGRVVDRRRAVSGVRYRSFGVAADARRKPARVSCAC